MTGNERFVLFAISMGAVIMLSVVLWGNQILERRRIRKTLNEGLMLKQFCENGIFRLLDLMTVYGVKRQPLRVEREGDAFLIYLCKTRHAWKKQSHEQFMKAMSPEKFNVALRLDKLNGQYILTQIARYCGISWQFRDWYIEYDRAKDGNMLMYLVFGGSFRLPKGEEQIPSFKMSQTAAVKIFQEFREGAK